MMTGEWPKNEIDHINGDSLDNRWINLREATHVDNATNRHRRKNRSGFVGVRKYAHDWGASFSADKKYYRLGHFNTPEEAHQAPSSTHYNQN
jgi:hypothetical protein